MIPGEFLSAAMAKPVVYSVSVLTASIAEICTSLMTIPRTSTSLRSETRFLKLSCGILIAATLLRLIWAALIAPFPVSDGEAYNILAHTLVEYHTYGWGAFEPSAFWPPGTSSVYAALYSVFGFSLLPIVAFNIVCGTTIVGLTIWIGRIFFDERTALIAGVLLALWPSEIAYVTILASELPFTLLVLLGIADWYGEHCSKPVRAILSGMLFGAATYFRPIGLLLPIVLLFADITNWQKFRSRLPMAALAMIVALATITPWSVRNFKVFGHPVLLTSSDGLNLWMGNNPKATGFYMAPPADTAMLNEYDQNKILGERAKKYIIAEPAAFVIRTIKKVVLLHVGETIAVYWNTEGIQQRFGGSAVLPLKVFMEGYWLVILMLALVGIAVMARQRGILQTLTHPAVLIWAYFTIVYAIILIADRFHFPSHPMISMLAAVAILAITTRITHDPHRNRPHIASSPAGAG